MGQKTGAMWLSLIMVISDNGASAEGGVHGTYNEMLFFNRAPETLEDNRNRGSGTQPAIHQRPLSGQH
jgi:arylsulfatase